jgi:HEPN domain-containing protein
VKSTREEGTRLIRKAEGILRRDAQGALNDKDFNLAVRRAQEAVELTLKGALKILGVDYPKVHDVAPLFSDQIRQKRGEGDPTVLQKIEDISLWLAESRAPSFYLEREYSKEDAEQAVGDAAFVVSETKKLLGLAAESA